MRTSSPKIKKKLRKNSASKCFSNKKNDVSTRKQYKNKNIIETFQPSEKAKFKNSETRLKCTGSYLKKCIGMSADVFIKRA